MQEIAARLTSERLTERVRAGVMPHIYQHCVANYPARPARLRMLLATSKDRRRLWRPGDACHPDRYGGRQLPAADNIPSRYKSLLDWYMSEYTSSARKSEREDEADPILRMLGLGKQLWADESGDEYVKRLRAGWE